MKKNYFPIFWLLFLLSLVLKRLALPAGSICLIIGAGALTIGYIIRGSKDFRSNGRVQQLAWFKASSSYYLALTFIGLLFRHQWWYFPNYSIIFEGLWPVFTVAILLHWFLLQKALGSSVSQETKNGLMKKRILPFVVLVILAIPSFLASTETFCKVFKPYTAAEWHEYWQKGNKNGIENE